MAIEFTEEEQTSIDFMAECLKILFGGEDFVLFFQHLLSNDPEIQACIKQSIVDCLLDPETSPLTKEFFGTIFQGTIGTEEGLDAITDTTGESPITFQGVKIKTIAIARKLIKLPVGG